jgi:SAM-dependent methyltransferase
MVKLLLPEWQLQAGSPAQSPALRRRRLLQMLGVSGLGALGVPARAPRAQESPATRGDRAEQVAPYVATPPAVVDAMLELGGASSRDTVVDLGSGDGRILIRAAERYGARGVGIDIDPVLVSAANAAAAQAGVQNRVRFFAGDLFQSTISQATLVTVYLVPAVAERLVAKLYEECAPGTRIVSHDYALRPLKPAKRLEMLVPEKRPITGTPQTFLYLYIIAAPVQGRWTLLVPQSLGGRLALVLEQRYDQLGGWLERDGARLAIEDASIAGADLSFAVPALASGAPAVFRLSLRGERLEGGLATGEGTSEITGFRAT